MNILFLGDSITDCGHCFTKDNLGNGYVKYVASHISGTAVNGGCDGFTFPSILRKYRQFYSGSACDTAVVAGGINEVGVVLNTGLDEEQAARFLRQSTEALKLLLNALSENGTGRILVVEPFLFPVPEERRLWGPCLEEVRRQIRGAVRNFPHAHSVGPSASIALLPVQDALDKLAASAGYGAITTDGIHLTDAGHKILAREILARLA